MEKKKNDRKIKKSAEKFGGFRKKLYLCNRF